MKKLVVLLMAMLVASSAFAIVDPDDNMMGLYFDMEADMPVIEAAPYTSHNLYLVMTNMTADTIWGFECAVRHEGTSNIGQFVIANATAIDVGTAGTPNHIVGFGTPTMVTPVTLLATMSVFYMGAVDEFFLTGSTPSTISEEFPVVLLADSGVLSVGMSAAEGPCAAIGSEVVATENVSFDGIKSLYR